MSDWGRAAFSPARVALVGASETPGKLGYLFARNLAEGFDGEVFGVHPRSAYPTLRAVPGPIDLAVVVTPAETVPDVIEDCARSGVSVALVITGGFAETGPQGRALQSRILAVARDGGVRLIGPNCFGLVGVSAGLNASLGMGLPRPGGISLYTQSGAYGMAAFMRSQEDGIGFAKVMATGNTADVDAVDAVHYFRDDPETRVIALLLESVGDGVALTDAIREASRLKPVVVMKTGRSGSGQRAAASHTAALAGDHVVARAALRQAGAFLVEDGLSLLDVAGALDSQPPLNGERVAIITNSGGTGVELADLLEERGLTVPRLSDALQRQLTALLPPHASALNPVDVTPLWQRLPQMYGESLSALADSGEVDVIVPVLLQRAAGDDAVVDAVIAAARRSTTPVHACWVAPQAYRHKRLRLVAAGVPCHGWPLGAAQALAGCLAPAVHPMPAREASLPPPGPDGWLDLSAALRMLDVLGLHAAPSRLAQDADAAVAAAGAVGYPVVVKAAGDSSRHKAALGLVRLNLPDADAVREAVEHMRFGPWLVQAQAAPGVELVFGARRDPLFGSVVVVGLGGVDVEAKADVAIRLAPFGQAEAWSMLEELRGAAVIGHWEAVVSALVRFSAGVARMPWCAELDVNPVIVSEGGLCAVDARLRVDNAAAGPARAPGAATRGSPPGGFSHAPGGYR